MSEALNKYYIPFHSFRLPCFNGSSFLLQLGREACELHNKLESEGEKNGDWKEEKVEYKRKTEHFPERSLSMAFESTDKKGALNLIFSCSMLFSSQKFFRKSASCLFLWIAEVLLKLIHWTFLFYKENDEDQM